jgi:hypothetical protein
MLLANNLKLLPNEKKYWEYIRQLRTCKENIDGFVEQINITETDQINYMSKHNDKYYICVSNGTPVGFIGVVDNDIRLATDPNHKGKGIGSFMVSEIVKIYPEAVAKVKLDNNSSTMLFKSLKFTEFKIDKQFRYFKYTNNNEVS